MALILKQGHNQKGYFTKDADWSQYDDIINLVVKSQFNTAFTVDPPIHEDILNEFWANAEEVTVNNNVIALRTTIQRKVMAITPDSLSIRLGLRDADASTQFPTTEIQQTMIDCGYQGNISHSTIFKKYFDAPHKLLFHYINMCLSPKTGSSNQMSYNLQCIFHSIVTKTPFKASAYFFNELVLHHNNTKKTFLLYPRFIMHCIIKELGVQILVGGISKLTPLTSQVYSRHNKPAAQPEDDQEEQTTLPLEPTASKPTYKKPNKTPKQEPKRTKRTAPQEVEIPEVAHVHSALDLHTTETSSQLYSPSPFQHPKPISIIYSRKKPKKSQTTDTIPTTTENQTLYGLTKTISSTSGTPHLPLQTGGETSDKAIDDVSVNPNTRDEEGPKFQSSTI